MDGRRGFDHPTVAQAAQRVADIVVGDHGQQVDSAADGDGAERHAHAGHVHEGRQPGVAGAGAAHHQGAQHGAHQLVAGCRDRGRDRAAAEYCDAGDHQLTGVQR
ncbi:hypothetical protein AZA_47611 [Nitrospirillum viridazoti Y2]|nr:hypothetical protein AZA_47611 [Nitrospirillum amazonense Y2]